ncbi:MAG: hypothetical protein HND59_13380 [Pseudomonadota bacterium]|nr:MAG: hypothetical protein HND59_13380 [Pseudomonadota bacterium]
MMRVAVHTLCEFAARSGDLDHRYTPSPSADEGIAGHARVRARRGAHYVVELPLAGECEGLALSGRADGYDTRKQCLEEIKTHRGDLSRLSAAQQALHWAQLRAYGALLCASEGLDAIELALVYYDVGRDRETRLTEQANAATLWELLATLCRVYRRWAEQEEAHRAARDAALAGLRFPFGDFSQGPARAGGDGLQDGLHRPASAAAGPDRPRQDRGHPLPGADGHAAPGGWTASSISPRATPGGNWRSTGWPAFVTGRRPRCRCGCWNSRRKNTPASIPISPATVNRVRWRRAFSTAWPRRATAPRTAPGFSIGTACARRRWPIRSAPTTWARRWRAGRMW